MAKQEIIERINALCKEAGLTHNQLASAVYEARDKRLREIRDEYQDKFLMFYFDDGLMMHEIKGRTIEEMVKHWPTTLQDIIKQHERKNWHLGMMLNNNIPASWATFPMSDQRFIRPQKF